MGKNAIITGSNRGIGSVVLEELASRGYNVWACARKKNSQFEESIKLLAEKYNVWIKPVYFDLSIEDEIKAGIQTIVADKQPIDILVNNAGMPYGGLMTMTPIAKLREVFEVNYFSQILMMQSVARVMMRQKSGCIINMASVGGIETNPGYLAYGSSKAALIWATKCVSKELGAYNIRVNAVAPGFTDAGMGHFNKQDEIDKMIEQTSLHRMATANEIAKGVAYLIGDDASFVTGHVLVIDGGRK